MAVLLVSELVTNAILYGRALELRAQAAGAGLRVEVHDHGPVDAAGAAARTTT